MRYSRIRLNFSGKNDFCKLGKKYSNDPLCKSGAFSPKHPETFDISHAFLPLIVTKLSALKQFRFLDHPVFSRWSSGALWRLIMFYWAFFETVAKSRTDEIYG